MRRASPLFHPSRNSGAGQPMDLNTTDSRSADTARMRQKWMRNDYEHGSGY